MQRPVVTGGRNYDARAAFVDQVSHKLRVQTGMNIGYDDGGYLGLPDQYPLSEQIAIDERLKKVEESQVRVITMLEEVLRRMNLRTPSVPSSSVSVSSVESSICSSPSRFIFNCPVCLNPQSTPKAHCEHMRKLGSGKGECLFNSSIMAHVAILNVFGNSQNFVRWYCSFLRAGVGSNLVDHEDVERYDRVNRILQEALVSGVCPDSFD